VGAAALDGEGAGWLVVGEAVLESLVAVGLGAASEVVGAGVDDVLGAAVVVLGVSIAPAPPTVGPQALSSRTPAASAVTRPAPALMPFP